MDCHQRRAAFTLRQSGLIALTLCFALIFTDAVTAQSTFGGNAQHTANYSPAAQNLNAVHWTASIDLNNTGGYAHYGAPLISAANTLFLPVKTGATNGFQINVFNAANGAALYSLSTDYLLPAHNWIPTYQPVLATGPMGTRLYYPGAGGTIYYIDNADSVSHTLPVQQVFYTSLANYRANASGFNSTVFINTPITADSSGNIFFGFRVNGAAPAPLSTTQSGFARIDPNGNATYVLAGTAAADSNIGYDTHNCAPALSNDGATVYVAVKSASTENYGYLLGLDSTTLATKYKVFLKDPRNNYASNATILDDSTASPMIGPDNDVYFGIYGNPSNGSRGFLLHFSGDLTVQKTPGGFGWDNTVAIVPTGMVPFYNGPSTYLLFSKYNNYANAGYDSADGVNRIAILDPNATQVDAHASSNRMLIMREVQTVIGPTADKENRGPSLPNAVREWCINTPAVNPATNSVYMPSEDGHLYRWNLVTNSLDQFLNLNIGIGLPYVPTLIGPDGQVYTLNGGTMSAMGNVTGVGVALTSSAPDVRTTVTGQSITFNVAITNTGTPGITPTGKVTLTDTTYAVNSPGVLTTTTTTLASNLALDGNGNAAYTTSALSADRHFISVSYSGDAHFSAASASLVQFVHARGTITTLTSTLNPSNTGQSVACTAPVAPTGSGTGTPTGQVTFRDGSAVLAQLPVNGSGVASFSTSALAAGSHSITAAYAGDTSFAGGYGSVVQIVQRVNSTTTTFASSANPSVYSQPVTLTTTVTATSPGSGVPTGTIAFQSGGMTAATATLDGTGRVVATTSALGVGSFALTVVYNGSANFSASTSPVLTQTVTKASATSSVMSSLNPSSLNQALTFTARVVVVAPGTATPDGSVTFKDGATVLGTIALSGGSASYSTSSLAHGAHNIVAVYNGSSNFLPGTSPVLVQTVN